MALFKITAIRAKPLISLKVSICIEKQHKALIRAESSTCRVWAQVSHKVIHRLGDQAGFSFPIMDLPGFIEVIPR
jgi:hypothetical protein